MEIGPPAKPARRAEADRLAVLPPDQGGAVAAGQAVVDLVAADLAARLGVPGRDAPQGLLPGERRPDAEEPQPGKVPAGCGLDPEGVGDLRPQDLEAAADPDDLRPARAGELQDPPRHPAPLKLRQIADHVLAPREDHRVRLSQLRGSPDDAEPDVRLDPEGVEIGEVRDVGRSITAISTCSPAGMRPSIRPSLKLTESSSGRPRSRR